MSLKSKLALSILGAAMMPLVAAHSAPTASNSQYIPQPSAPQPSAPTSPSISTQAGAQSSAKAATAQVKGHYKDQQPAAPAFTWEGPYLGVYGGYAWGNSEFNSNAGVLTGTSYFTSTANINSVSQHASGKVHPNNIIGGVQIGNNLESGSFIYGGVLDFGSFHMENTKSATGITYPTFAAKYSLKTTISTSWLASLRARLGVAPSSCWPLLYLTGGVAITNLNVTNSFRDNAPSLGEGGGNSAKVLPGWIIGAGAEYHVRGNWTVDGEYLYVHFGSTSANGFVTCRAGACPGTRSPFSTAGNLNANMVRVGLNYKFS